MPKGRWRRSTSPPSVERSADPMVGRELIYIPILHTQHDMGSLSDSARKAYVGKLGEKAWRHHLKAIEEMWAGIHNRLSRLNLPFKKVYVYQDGLPVCGKELEIVADLAKKGSPNHSIIQWIVDHGGQVIGTEDPKLLVQEYNHIKAILRAQDKSQRKRLTQEYEKEAPALLRKRDTFIRDRIMETLPRGVTGVLFMGLLHRVDEILPPDIRVSYLIYRLPFHRSFEMGLVR